ncbi:heparinase II/III family protein [Kribbella sp. NPDC005582]|uniref:heparinase II/III domain-containing protein n=1 Tax=Kribbella sp. NPDC005582 TaxID=3156893 RepID=UPI0033AD957D
MKCSIWGVAGLVVGTALAMPAMASGQPANGPGIRIAADVPEPEDAQFVPEASNVVPATAKGATDIRRNPAAKAAAGTYVCPGFSTIDDAVPLTAVLDDTFIWGTFPPYKVGDGNGNINWKLNPYDNPSWYMWFHSLRWIGQSVTAAAQGDAAAMARMTAIARDWVTDNPYSWKADLGAWESTMHRTNVLICVRQAVLANRAVETLPAEYAWLDKALVDHGTFLTNNWSGAWNHGTDESIALFGVGCTLNREDFLQLAQQRFATGITTSIDPQGGTNEQSTGYAQFNYSLWGRAVDAMVNCGTDPGTTINQRRVLLAKFVAHATTPKGTLQQIGDTDTVKTYNIAGTPLEYVATAGQSGTPPAERVGLYTTAGFAFGRSGWGTTTPFAGESAYSLRFGPRRMVHGHSDHDGLTYQARGRDILIDPGYPGYKNSPWRTWAKGPLAHSSMTVPQSADPMQATKLERYTLRDQADFYELKDSPGVGVNRTRAVLVVRKPDLIVTLDRATATKSQQFQTLWHLPSDQNVVIESRSVAVARKAGENTRTVILQVPYKQAIPAGATLVRKGLTRPIQGWHYPTPDLRYQAPTVVEARIGTSASILSFLIPLRANAKIGYTTRQSGTTYVVDLTVDGLKTSIGVTGGGSLVRLA